MSEIVKDTVKDVLDIILCGFFMAVFCVVPFFMLTGLLRGTGIAVLIFGFVVAAFCGMLSGFAVLSDRRAKACIKWAVSAPFSIGIFNFLINTSFVPRLERALNAAPYSHGDGIALMLLLGSMLAAVGIGNIIGVVFSGRQLSAKAERVEAVLQRVICPVSCAVTVVLVIFLICIMPPPLPPVYG